MLLILFPFGFFCSSYFFRLLLSLFFHRFDCTFTRYSRAYSICAFQNYIQSSNLSVLECEKCTIFVRSTICSKSNQNSKWNRSIIGVHNVIATNHIRTANRRNLVPRISLFGPPFSHQFTFRQFSVWLLCYFFSNRNVFCMLIFFSFEFSFFVQNVLKTMKLEFEGERARTESQ